MAAADVTAATMPRLAPACHGCAGGGDVNGLPCRECGGRGRQRRPLVRAAWRGLLHRWSLAAAGAAGTAVRLSATIPGIGGAVAVSVGAALVVHGLLSQVPALGVGVLVGGVFALLVDRRLLGGGVRRAAGAGG